MRRVKECLGTSALSVEASRSGRWSTASTFPSQPALVARRSGWNVALKTQASVRTWLCPLLVRFVDRRIPRGSRHTSTRVDAIKPYPAWGTEGRSRRILQRVDHKVTEYRC